MLRLIALILSVWAEAARRSGWLVIALFVAAAVGAGFYAAANLGVNTDTSEMLDPSLPFQEDAAALRAAFPQIKTDIVVIVKAPTLDEADAFAGALRDKLLTRSDVLSGVFAPAEEPFFLQNGLLYLDESDLESRLTQLTKAAGLIETLVKQPTADTFFQTLADNDELAEKSELGKDALDDIYAELAEVVAASNEGRTRPFSWMGALNADEPGEEGYIRLVYATPVLDFSRVQPAKPALEAIRADIAAVGDGLDGRIETFITGDPALRAEELQSVRTGLGLSFTVSFVLVGVLMILAYGSFALAGMTMLGLVITLALTTAFAAGAIGELNLVSVAFIVLLFGLGQDFAIHLLLHIQERRADGASKKLALRGAVREVGPALVLAAAATSLAFFSFIPTAFDGIAQLGVIAGVGVLIAIFVSLTFLPAALGALPPPRMHKPSKALRSVFAMVEGLSVPVAIVTALVGIAALFILPSARFDADPMTLRDPASESVRGFNLLFSDDDTIPYRLTLLEPDAAAAEAASEKAKALSTVAGARSLPDFVPQDQEAKLELIDFAAGALAFALDAEPEPRAPATGAGLEALQARLAAAYAEGPQTRLAALLHEAGAAGPEAVARIEANIFRYWPQLTERLRAQLSAEPVDIDSLPAPLASRYRSEDGHWRVDILPNEDVRRYDALRRFVDEVETAFPHVSGGALQTMKAGEVISQAVFQATLIALALISLFLYLFIRRPTLVLFMVLPLIVAAVLTAATGVLLGMHFNYANVIVLPLLLGIGIDSGIHLVMRHEHMQEDEGIYGTSTPRAILFSQLTTVASFGSLILSPHRGTASMGELLTISIGYTLICTLFLLPVVFKLRARRTGRP